MSTRPTLVLIGDSIRNGYCQHVVRELADEVAVFAPAQNGGNSRNVLAHLDEWVLKQQPDLVHVNCGLHDLKRAFGETPEVPLEVYRGHVRQILERLGSGLQGTIVWATTTPVDQELHHRNKAFDRFEADVEAYNEAASREAEALGIPINDLFAVIEAEGKNRLLTQDGVHFTEEGSQILGRAVAAWMRQYLGH